MKPLTWRERLQSFFGEKRSVEVPRGILKTPQEFAGRYDELMGVGYHWLKFTAVGIVEENLVVMITVSDLVVAADEVDVFMEAGGTCVLLIGHTLGSAWELRWRLV